MTEELERTAELVFGERRNLHSALKVSAAEAADAASVQWITRRLAILSWSGDRHVLVDGPIAVESSVGSAIVDNKQLTREFLAEKGVPTPQGVVASDAEDAVGIAQRFARNVVVKPLSGSEGKGVTVDLSAESEIRAAFIRADQMGRGVLVEEYIEIEEEYRCMATPSECLSVIKRVLPRVTGNGQHTVEELIDEKNRARSENPALFRLLIPKDDVVDSVLSRQGLSRASVPAEGETVLVRNIGGLTGGGEPHECTKTVDESVRDTAQRAVASIPGLGWAGVDVVTEKQTGRAFVLEININAGYGGVTFPVEGEPLNVAGRVWEDWRDITQPELGFEARFPAAKGAERRLSEVLPNGWGDTSRQRLGRAFIGHLRRQSGDVHVYGNAVVRFTPAGEEPKWFTMTAGGLNDLLGPRRTVRSHGKVRQFLTAADVPRPWARRITSQMGLERMFEASNGPFTANPDRAEWASRLSRELARPALPGLQDRAWVIQRQLSGRRLRLYCTRQKVWAVTAVEPLLDVLSDADLTRAAELSLRAVRAIPGLRWAAVDTVVWDRRGSDNGDRIVLVEGVTVTPMLQADDFLVGGDLSAFFDWIAGIDRGADRKQSLISRLLSWVHR